MSFMNNVKKATNVTLTENGDIAYKSTYNANLDFFGGIASQRGYNNIVEDMFEKAYYEDRVLALKNMFYLRDINNGCGERESFRTCLSSLLTMSKSDFLMIMPFIPEFGRWDDLLIFVENPSVSDEIVAFISKQLNEDINNEMCSLLGKWLPTESSKIFWKQNVARILAKKLFNNDRKAYRKTLKMLRDKIDIIETKLVNKDYSFDYNKLTGKAMLKYRNAFSNNDNERYQAFLDTLKTDSSVIGKKVKKLFPYELASKVSYYCDEDLLNSMWASLPKDTTNKKILVVADGSGSMERCLYKSKATCLDVANSLALYSAERLTGDFKNRFITFSDSPRFVEIKEDKTFVENIRYIRKFNEVSSTDIEKTYNLIFETSVECIKNGHKEDIPEIVLIISDMEFNYGSICKESTFETLKRKYEEAGIVMPKMVYWNVNVSGNVHFTSDSHDNIYVSGFSSQLFDNIANGDTIVDAVTFMIDTLKRYIFIDELIKSN